jgi:hypothetical protein
MISTLDYKDAGIAQRLKELLEGRKKLTIYFGLHGGKTDTADHIADYLFRRNTYYLHVQGHGIAAKTFSYAALDELIAEMLRFNGMFNLTDQIHVEEEG